MRRSILFAASLALSTGLAVTPAAADGIITWVPTLHVPISTPETQATVGLQLSAQGYRQLIFSAFPADTENPHPELNPSQTNAPERALMRPGWNGVGTKNGETVQIYASTVGN